MEKFQNFLNKFFDRTAFGSKEGRQAKYDESKKSFLGFPLPEFGLSEYLNMPDGSIARQNQEDAKIQKEKERRKKLGLDKLSLTERDIFLCILFLQEKNKLISLENIIKNCRHPRATLFRCLKKLRSEKIIQVKKDTADTRKSFITISSKYS